MLFKKQKPAEEPRRSPALSRRANPLPSAPAGRVYSYRANRSQRQEVFGRLTPEKSANIKAWRDRLAWLRSTPRLIAILAVIVAAIIMLRLDPAATVIPMDDAKGQVFLRRLSTYEESIRRIFANSWSNGNKLTVNAAQISADIKKQFPELKTVSISLPLLGSRPVVYIQPAIPALVMTTRDNSVFVVDTSGMALITGNQVVDFAKLKVPVVEDRSGLALSAGQLALPTSNVRFITEVAGQLKAKNVAVSNLSLPAEAGELQVRVEGKPYFVKFNLYGDAREEAGAYLAVKRELESMGKNAAQYIDVRVPGKAYYK